VNYFRVYFTGIFDEKHKFDSLNKRLALAAGGRLGVRKTPAGRALGARTLFVVFCSPTFLRLREIAA
jgi:hypothetical protein